MAYRQEYSSLSDSELVQLFHKGEKHGAYTEVVLRYQKKIYFAAKRLVNGDHDEADEVAQDTFVKAYEALGNFRGDAQVYTWLYRIMMNAVIQRSRRQKVRKAVGLEEVTHTVESTDIRADKQIERSETTKIIEMAIETLPAKQKQVFLMRFYDELPYEEIAEIVGTSVGGLKANYFHAVKKIGEYLTQYGKVSPEFSATLGDIDKGA